MNKNKPRRRKFLKSIYAIQEAFGQEAGRPQRTISCGLIPTLEEEKQLSKWFDQVTAAKRDLYNEIYADFKKNPSKFLGSKDRFGFDYQTFFKGRKVLENLNAGRPLLTSQPVMEGLRNEIEGTMRSFKTNFARLFNESIARAKILGKTIEQNNGVLNKKAESSKPENSGKLLGLFQSLGNRKINHILLSFKTILEARDLIDLINAEVGNYNRELNEIISAYEILREEIQPLRKLGRLPMFPRSSGKVEESRGKILRELESFAKLPFDMSVAQNYLKRRIEKLDKLPSMKVKNKMRRFEDRLINWLVKNKDGGIDEKTVNKFVKNIDSKLKSLDRHLRSPKKDRDARTRNEYFRLLALRAKLSGKKENGKKENNINLLLSRLRGTFLSGKKEREIVNIPGFSWADKPRKNATLALKGGQLYICISNSVSNFKINSLGDLSFVKSTGGSRQKKAHRPKNIEYVQGSFDIQERENITPLFLKLHFGKSYVRRNLFHLGWGVFSKKPRIFLNAGKLKRDRETSNDKWRYFFDLSVSGEKIYSLKEFSNEIHKSAEAVVGVDRGEVRPIAYAVLSTKNGDLLKKGFLASEYIKRLEHYDRIKRGYQKNSQTFPRYLRSKVSLLKETMMATAASEILEIVGRYKAIVVMEDLGSNFMGAERHVIPKRTYKKIEKLTSSVLEQAGILRIIQPKGKKKTSPYWGALLQVYPGGTSQTCLRCGRVWNSGLKNAILEFSESNNFTNVDFGEGALKLTDFEAWMKDQKLTQKRSKDNFDDRTSEQIKILNGKTLKLNKEFQIFNKKNREYEKKATMDIESLLNLNFSHATRKERNKAFSWLRHSIGPRIKQELFICPSCGFQENTDIVGAINIAKRGIESLQRLHKGD